MSVPHARPCSKPLHVLTHLLFLHYNPRKCYLYSHFVDNKADKLRKLPKVSYLLNGSRTGIWMSAVRFQSVHPLNAFLLYVMCIVLWEYGHWPYMATLSSSAPNLFKVRAKVSGKIPGIVTRILPIINFRVFQFCSWLSRLLQLHLNRNESPVGGSGHRAKLNLENDSQRKTSVIWVSREESVNTVLRI